MIKMSILERIRKRPLLKKLRGQEYGPSRWERITNLWWGWDTGQFELTDNIGNKFEGEATDISFKGPELVESAKYNKTIEASFHEADAWVERDILFVEERG